jgi:hypothetical protein
LMLMVYRRRDAREIDEGELGQPYPHA